MQLQAQPLVSAAPVLQQRPPHKRLPPPTDPVPCLSVLTASVLSRPASGIPPPNLPGGKLSRWARVPLSVHATFRSARRYTKHMDFSFISQIDGLAYSLAGVRIERDVLAASNTVSYTPNYGMLSFEFCASFFGLYFTASSLIPEVIISAAKCRACGVFVVPVRPGAAPLDDKRRSWFDLLMTHSLLTFPLPPGAAGFGTTYGVQAVLASFNFVGRLKSKRRPEKRFPVFPVARLNVAPFQIGVLPIVITRASPSETSYMPASSADTVASTAPIPAAKVSSNPPPTAPFLLVIAGHPLLAVRLPMSSRQGTGLARDSR